jgi:hypothetical protein
MRKLAVVLVGLLLLLIIADRVGVGIAENRAAALLQNSQKLRYEPQVDITGFPFLTQVAGKELDEVDVTAKDVPLGSNGVTILASRLTVAMQQVDFDYSFDRVTVGHGTGQALVSYRQLNSVLPGVDLSYGGAADKVHASVTTDLPVVGRRTIGLTLDPKLAGDAVNFGVSAITGLPSSVTGFLLDEVRQRISSVVGRNVSLTDIPFQLRVTGVSAQPDGISVGLAGERLTFQRR